MTLAPEPPVSPCVQICTLDDANVCVGCYRSLQEIGDWSRMTAAEQQAVIERAERRRGEREQPRWLETES